MDEFENPALGEVLGEQGEFGEGEGQQVVELVDEAGALADGRPGAVAATWRRVRSRVGQGLSLGAGRWLTAK